MEYSVKNLPKSLKEIKFAVSADDLKPFMEKAVVEMSQRVKIEGFRPGKAPYDIVKGKFGEMAILEEALPAVVQKYFVEAVTKEKIETVGEPRINVEKAAPGNEVVFTATVALLPHVTKLADYHKISVEPKETKIEEPEVDKVVGELRKMQSSERPVEREARAGDKVTIDMDMTLDKVAVEGGTARDHAIYLDEQYYVPGFNEQLFGAKKDEAKTFTLKFPKEHYQKNLAGKDVEFSVKIKKIEEVVHPEADDKFAKTLGMETLDKLRALLRKNLEEEAGFKERQRQEIALMEKLVNGSTFDDIPEVLVNAEAHKMLHELEHSVEHQNLGFDDYLKQIKKTRDQLLLDFTPDAVKRVKSALIVREVAAREKLEADDKEVIEEQTKMLNMYKDDAATQEQIRSEDGEAYIRMVLRNRKVIGFLRDLAVKKK